MKNSEKVGTIGKNWEPIFLTVYEALHMKIYEPPHMNFGELRSPGSTGQYREASDSARKHPQRRTAFGNCGNKLKYQFGCQRYISTILNTFSIIYGSLER